jgi:hypothetical protein
MTRIFLSNMADESDPDEHAAPERGPAARAVPSPACGRVQDLAGDVVGEVMQACPRCTGSGPDCLIDLMYAEAFPSRQRH